MVSCEGLFAVFVSSFPCSLHIKQLLSEWVDRICHSAMMLNIRFYSVQRRLEIWDHHKILLKLDSGQISEGKTENRDGGDAKSRGCVQMCMLKCKTCFPCTSQG